MHDIRIDDILGVAGKSRAGLKKAMRRCRNLSEEKRGKGCKNLTPAPIILSIPTKILSSNLPSQLPTPYLYLIYTYESQDNVRGSTRTLYDNLASQFPVGTMNDLNWLDYIMGIDDILELKHAVSLLLHYICQPGSYWLFLGFIII